MDICAIAFAYFRGHFFILVKALPHTLRGLPDTLHGLSQTLP